MNERVLKAFDLWVELTGIDPNSSSWSSRNWDIRRANEQLKESVKLDDSLATTLLMLRYFVKEFLSGRQFSVMDIINDYDTFQAYISKSKELIDILHSGEAEDLKNDLQDSLKEALKHYGVERQDVLDVVNNPDEMAFIKRDALKSIQELELHQFTQGEADTNSNASYFKHVYQFWNINSLLRNISVSSNSGVSLNLIKDDKNPMYSYFAFAIRNGGTISILTDRPKWVHPNQKNMIRRPGRDFSERIFRHHFPYSLMDIKYDYRGDAFVSDNGEGLVPYQKQSIPLKEIKDLEPDEVIWLIMMFELIENKFWKENYKTKELSYTAEMMKITGAAEGLITSLALTEYKPIVAPELKSSEVTTGKLTSDWEHKTTGHNDWIEQRYEHLIQDDLLNLVDSSNTNLLLPPDNMNITELVKMTDSELKSYNFHQLKPNMVEVKAMNPSDFGTKDELLSDQRWYARFNKAKQLKVLADKEYNEWRNDVLAWYENAIKNNINTLLHSIAIGELIVPVKRKPTFSDNSNAEYVEELSNILSISDKDESYWEVGKNGVYIGQKLDEWKYGCYLTGSPFFLRARFNPATPEALALLCGIEVADLPDVLQHYITQEPYHGNSILSRIDPLEWVVKNPWSDLGLGVVIYLSKSGYNQLRKNYSLPPNKFWNKKNN